jgi:tetratricopeptide (TPR) repeat protein
MVEVHEVTVAFRKDDAQTLLARAADLQAKGKPADALRALSEARQSEPDNADVIARLGGLLMNMGRPAEALGCFERLCQLKRGEATPVHDRSVALMALGRHAEAIEGFDMIIAAQPRFVPAHYNRGVALGTLGRNEEALASYDNALKLDANHVLALNNRGVALQALGRNGEAIKSFERAIALDPRCAAAHCNMANGLRQLNRFEDALASCDRALAIDPNYVTAVNEKGVALGKLGRLEPAVEVFRRTIALDPNYVEAHENLFVVLTELGRNDEAIGSIEEAIRLAPGRVRPYYNLTETRKIKQGDPRIPAMELIASRMDELGTTAQIEICFSLGKTYADLKDYDRSFPWLAKGCKLKRAITDYNEAGTLEMMRRAATAFDAKTLKKRAGVGEPSTSPVFILGMPRSGTTLVEQILASHPQVFAAGEIEAFLSGMIEAAARSKSEDTPEAFAAYSDEQLRDLGRDYLARTRPMAPDAARIVDKSLQSFRFAGLIQLALPGAKFIHVKRNPLDTCLSCFTKLFVSELPFTYDLAELGRYYKGYEGLMKHWRKAMPAKSLIEVQYEDVVDDLETQAKRIVAHAGLDWDPACLDFHTTDRPVRTASLMQVRQPIYTSAVQRWKTYEKHLGPLQEALGLA